MKKYLSSLPLMALLFFLGSCIKNDIPYPHIEGVITDISVEHMQGEPTINRQQRTIEINVSEDAQLSKLRITRLQTNPESRISPDSLHMLSPKQFPRYGFGTIRELPANANTCVDARSSFTLLLHTYQDYLWSISVKQPMSRSIELDKQMGEALFDVVTHTAIAYVEPGTDLKNIQIKKLKLESAKASIHPDPATVHDFTRPREFVVSMGGEEISRWTLDVQFSQENCRTGVVNAYAHRAMLSGSMRSGATPTVSYRKKGESAWREVPADKIKLNSSVSFTAYAEGLSQDTEYEWQVSVDGKHSPIASFRSEAIEPIANLSLDTWTQGGHNWYANPVPNNLDDAQAYWASGNEGITSTVAGSREPTTIPVDGDQAYKGRAARMISLTGVPLVGSAAGNLFIGTYKTNIGSPKDSPQFGRPFEGARPDGLRGYYKYKSMPITNGTQPGTLKYDECCIYMTLWDEAGNEIAYGEFVGTQSVSDYRPFEFRLNYTRPQAKIAKLTIVATSSHYGGLFEGAKVVGQVGQGSTLWVDEMEVIYDKSFNN